MRLKQNWQSLSSPRLPSTIVYISICAIIQFNHFISFVCPFSSHTRIKMLMRRHAVTQEKKTREEWRREKENDKRLNSLSSERIYFNYHSYEKSVSILIESNFFFDRLIWAEGSVMKIKSPLDVCLNGRTWWKIGQCYCHW